MRKVIILFFGIILLIACDQKKTNCDLIQMKLKDNVKSIIVYQYDAYEENGVIKKDTLGYSSDYYYFNKFGMIEKHFEINLLGPDSDGEPTFFKIFNLYQYNKEGDLLEITTKFDTLLDEVHSKTLYKYDSKNRIIEKENTENYYTPIEKYYYDNADNLIYKIIYDLEGNKRQKYSFTYNKYNKVIEFDIYDFLHKEIINKEQYEYDTENYLRFKKVEVGEVPGTYKYTYNEKGDVSEELYIYSVFDLNGFEGEITLNKKYNFDKEDVSKIMHKYKYDKKNNWIERLENNREMLYKIYERKINY